MEMLRTQNVFPGQQKFMVDATFRKNKICFRKGEGIQFAMHFINESYAMRWMTGVNANTNADYTVNSVRKVAA